MLENNGTFRPIDEQEYLTELTKERAGRLFRIGEIIEIKGNLFKVKKLL
jgi:hypothetical protein